MNCLPTSVEELHAGSRRQLHRALEAGKGLVMERHFHQGFCVHYDTSTKATKDFTVPCIALHSHIYVASTACRSRSK